MDIRKTVSMMTLEEKAAMLSGKDMWHLKGVERLGVPSVMVTDGPHGLRKQAGSGDHLGLNDSVTAICYPTAASLASTFDRGLVNEVGKALGDECQAEDVAVILGPGVNIKRSPLCGRNFEYFSEDPYAAGEMAVAHISGVQSKNVGTSLKHYCANNQETRRMSTDTIVDERTLREIYLTAFEAAVKRAKPWTVMGSYNRINGVFGCENDFTLNKILRDEWGFDGYIMTDWGALNDKILSHKNGLDLQMPGGNPSFDKKLVDAVKNGELDEKVLDTACERIIEKTMKFVENKVETPFEYEKHHALARRVEADAMVLLKNSGVLPLTAGKKVALIGKFAETPVFQGGGSSHINCYRITSPLEAFKDYDGEVVYAQGYITEEDKMDEKLLGEAVDAARGADIAVIIAGMPEGFESEGFDRKHLYMPSCQNELISAVAAANPNTVVVLQNSSAVMMPWLDSVSAVIGAYLGGEAVGGAIYDVITGMVNPSGKLAETFPLKLEDNPSYLYFPGFNNRVEYREGIFVGYRYYDKKGMQVMFPFGHGLSYTTFEYSDINVEKAEMTDTETLKVTARITNTGKVKGKETAFLFVGHPTYTVERPVRELKGFEKVELEPGESKTVSFTLDKRSFAYYDVNAGDWLVEDKDYTIEIGASSRDLRLKACVHIKPAKPVFPKVNYNTTLGELMTNPAAAEVISAMLKGFLGGMPSDGADNNALGMNMFEMMKDTPLRAMVSFSGGAFSEEMAFGLIEKINSGN